jgi:hypothetical protein
MYKSRYAQKTIITTGILEKQIIMGLRTPGRNQKGLKKLPKTVRNKMGYAKNGRRKNQMGGPMDPNMQNPNMMPQDPMMDQSMAAPGEDFIEPETQIKFGAPRDKKFFGGKGRARRQARRDASQPGAGIPGGIRKPGMGGGMKQQRPGMGAEGSQVPNIAQRMKDGPMMRKPGLMPMQEGGKVENQNQETRKAAKTYSTLAGNEKAAKEAAVSKKTGKRMVYDKESSIKAGAHRYKVAGRSSMQTGGRPGEPTKAIKSPSKGQELKKAVRRTYSTLAGDAKAAAEARASKGAGKSLVYDKEASIKAGKNVFKAAGRGSMMYGGLKKKVGTNLPREKALFGKIAGAIGGIKRAKKEGKKLGSGLLKEAGKGALAGGVIGRVAGAAQGFFDKENKGKGLGNRLRQAGAGALGGFNQLANTELSEAAKTKGGLKDYLGDKLQGLKGKLGNKGEDKPKEDKKPSRQPVAPPMTAMVQTGGRPEDRRRKKKSGSYTIESTSSGRKMADTLGVKKNRKRAQTGMRKANKRYQKQKELENEVKKYSVESDTRGEAFGQESKLTQESQKAKEKASAQLQKVQDKRTSNKKRSRRV